MNKRNFGARRVVRAMAVASLMSAVALGPNAAPAADDAEARAQQDWRTAVVHTEAPAQEGCFYSEYPNNSWTKLDCTLAPSLPYPPRGGIIKQTVGDGADYAAEESGQLKHVIGWFPTVKGVKTEKGIGGANDYSLQLNSNFMRTAACTVKGCITWQQFIYSSGANEAFMQYWEIGHGHPCASGWIANGTKDCYRNSAAVVVHTAQPIANLSQLVLSGAAAKGGKDTLVFAAETRAYRVTGSDSVVDLATDWHQAEFNIIGDCCGSGATFNKGSSLQVDLEILNGTTTKPLCVGNAGTTAETNNLNLKACSTFGGANPQVEFVESN